MSVKAVFLYPKCGTEFDQERAQSCGLEVKREYEVSHFVMGQSSTSVYLEGYTFHFEFLEDGKPLDIFRDPRFNPYLRRMGGGGRR